MRGRKSPYFEVRKACGRDSKTPVRVVPGDTAPSLGRAYLKRRRWFSHIKQWYEDYRFRSCVHVGVDWLRFNDQKAFSYYIATERLKVEV